MFPSLVPTSEVRPRRPREPRRVGRARPMGEALPHALREERPDPRAAPTRPLQAHVPGAKGQPHERFWGGHFVQEDRGDYLAERIVGWLGL